MNWEATTWFVVVTVYVPMMLGALIVHIIGRRRP